MTRPPRVAMRIQKQQRHKLRAIRVHNQRQNPRDLKIIDPNKSKENVCLYRKHNVDVDQAVRGEITLRHQADKKIRKDAVVALEFVVSASPIHFRPWDENAAGEYDKDKVQAWAEANIEAMKKKFGDNLIQVDLHLDETTPHLHVIVVPVMEKTNSMGETVTRFDAKTLTKKSGIWSYEKMQDFFAEAVADLGIERGLRGSRAAHEELKEIGNVITQAVQDYQDLEIPDFNRRLKRKTFTEKVAGFFKQDKVESDGEYFLRMTKWLKSNFDKFKDEANHTIKTLSKALAKVTHQLEREREKNAAYSELVDNPQELITVKKDLEMKASMIESRESQLDLREGLLRSKEIEVDKDHVVQAQKERIDELKKSNQRLTFKVNELEEKLNPTTK
jgi:hypothetical protein